MGVSDGPRRVATAPGLLITQRSEIQINPATRRDDSAELVGRAVRPLGVPVEEIARLAGHASSRTTCQWQREDRVGAGREVTRIVLSLDRSPSCPPHGWPTSAATGNFCPLDNFCCEAELSAECRIRVARSCVSPANDLAHIICLRAALCALAVGLVRCNPRRHGTSGRAAPAWRGRGWLSSAGTLGVGPGVYQKRCVTPPSRHPAMTVWPGTRGSRWRSRPSAAAVSDLGWRTCGASRHRPDQKGVGRDAEDR
jgi:hypothetical protein